MTQDARKTPPSSELARKRGRALELIRDALPAGPGKLAVAFSGGVDSTLLLALAAEAVGPARVVAVTARSESLPEDELRACERIAASLGTKLVLVRTNELAREGYVANAPSRCYHCKSELFETLDREVARLEGIVATAYGAIADDLAEGQHRPGMRAASERGVLRPLADAGLFKVEVRELSRALGLETWDKPQMACLASRIPYGQPVTAEKLSQVERAEAVLKRLGFRDVRVRNHADAAPGTAGGGTATGGSWARIEIGESELERAVARPARETIARELRALGFKYVTLDLEGFRSGRLNEDQGTQKPAVTPPLPVVSHEGAVLTSSRKLPLA